jgi:hypothetical protein
MKRSSDVESIVTSLRSGRRQHAAFGSLALVLALGYPGVAHPFSLEQLLNLPLEKLLTLEITSQRVAPAAKHGAWPARLMRAGGRAP